MADQRPKTKTRISNIKIAKRKAIEASELKDSFGINSAYASKPAKLDITNKLKQLLQFYFEYL